MASDPELRRSALEVVTKSDVYGASYMWKWLGLPVIQLPEDIVTIQEIIWETGPQVVIEAGFARGGSSILYASILSLAGNGRVVSIDTDIREHNRHAVEGHPLGDRVTLIEGSSTAPATFAKVREALPEGGRIMVVLDSDHTHDHVLDELRLYGPLVTPGQFMVVADTVIEEIPRQEHRPRPWGPGNNPRTALDAYLAETGRFLADPWFNSKLLVSASRGGYLRCVG